MNREEIRKKLGLLSVEDRLAWCRANFGRLDIADISRQTGRTTEMLLSALEKASEGVSIDVVGFSPSLTRLMRHQAREMAEKAGIALPERSLDVRASLVFHDHTCHERRNVSRF